MNLLRVEHWLPEQADKDAVVILSKHTDGFFKFVMRGVAAHGINYVRHHGGNN